jgi:hypothetical protein
MVAVAATVLRDYAKSNHDFGYELAMRVGEVTLQRNQSMWPLSAGDTIPLRPDLE